MQKIRRVKAKILPILLSILTIFSLFLIPKAYGSKEENYEYARFYGDGTLLYRFTVEVIIETENDGTWIPSYEDYWYRIDYIITLDYINKTRIESLVFFYKFSSPISVYPCSFKTIKNETEIMKYPGQSDVLSFEITAYPAAFNPRVRIIPSFEYNYTFLSTEPPQSISYYTCWTGIKPIYIDKKESKPVSESTTLEIAILGILIGVGIGGTSVFLGIKIGEKRSRKKGENIA